jgi:hypothetical protein
VQLNKTSGIVNPPETAAQNASAQNAKTAAAAPSANAVSKIPQSAAPPELARSLGLPADKISASIISFAKFFSLPLKPEA